MKPVALLVFVHLVLISAIADARTWLVRQDGSGDCTGVQGCVDSASTGDTVLVGPGTYDECLDMKSGVVLTSEQGPAMTKIQRADGCGHAVITMYMCDENTVVNGFTIAHGYGSVWPLAGGVWMSDGVLSNNLIIDNYSTGLDVGGPAGGVWCSSGIVASNTIVNNYLYEGQGAGIYICTGAGALIERNIIVGNTGGYGIYCETGAAPSLTCNNVWQNEYGNYGGACPDLIGTNGNISVDPLFCAPVVEDFYLRADSPCLNAPGCGLIGAFAQGCPATSVKEQPVSWGRIKVLFR